MLCSNLINHQIIFVLNVGNEIHTVSKTTALNSIQVCDDQVREAKRVRIVSGDSLESRERLRIFRRVNLTSSGHHGGVQ